MYFSAKMVDDEVFDAIGENNVYPVQFHLCNKLDQLSGIIAIYRQIPSEPDLR